MVTKDLGMVTAYAYAVAGGYTGTEAEFTQLMADLAVVVDDFDNFSVNVTTLPAGSSATASYADGVLSLGIPKGDTGATGATGETGAPAGFGTVSATVDDNIGTPSVEVTASGADTAKNFAFAFHNLKGEKGDKGDTGEVSEAELTQAFADFSENGTVANAEQLTTDIKANDQTPYLFRTSGGSVDIGDREYINGIVGGTVAWNQQAPNTELTGTGSRASASGTRIVKGHKYLFGAYLDVSETLTSNAYISPYGFDDGTVTTFCVLTGISKGDIYKIGISTASGVSDGTGSNVDGNFWFYMNAQTGSFKNLKLFDLTQMFGSTIADYIYSLETANAGAGVAWFKKLFPKPYYAYNAGELMSVNTSAHNTVGFNALDPNNLYQFSANSVRTTNPIPVIGGQTYELCCDSLEMGTGSRATYMVEIDADGNETDNASYGSPFTSLIVTMKSSTVAVRLDFYTNAGIPLSRVLDSNPCLHLVWDGSRDGEYEPYVKHSYPLDSSLTLRGIPKLDANNNLYYDGDTYESDGTVTRKYGIVDLGTLTWQYNSSVQFFQAELTNIATTTYAGIPNAICSSYGIGSIASVRDGSATGVAVNSAGYVYVRDPNYTDATVFKTAMNGVKLQFELATPTTESADPYTNPQIVNDFGTEEFVLSDSVFPVPVGHNTDYPINLKAKVEMMPNSPSGDGDYIVRQTNGVNEYVSIAGNATIQDILTRLEALEG